ncbi:hypothetical protein HELRODRAFT_71212 [Helobdella robusta]|uniref:AB hydrolase-1 domain-containing protein n=1 Tax=Helobdella robusta TaxID=6412 RepID=T1G0H9_HELRO|nr:hypothetical protein HELRODRAFT_71212 [Helobdella robusta]ESN90538.1 hypothetical protein HELRODRAFT_71212 [Helobdella robusta]
MYREFIEHPKMAGIRSRTIWVNIDVPGQGQNEPDLPADYQFPSMQQIGEDLVHVLNQLKFKEVICLGEGAGANIIARFAMAHIERVLGIVLMHATGTTSGLFESIKDKLLSWKLDPIKVNQSAESYLVLHRFGGFSKASDKDELKTIIEGYQEMLRTRTNAKNLKMFVEMFFNRSSLTESIKKITCPILLVTGQQSIFNGTTRSLHQAIMKECKDKTKVEFIEVAGVANVLEEKPDKLIECFQYFLQGLGVGELLDGWIDVCLSPPRGRSMSMQEYDLPLRQRLFSAQLSSTPPIFDAPSCDSAENSTDPNSPANSPVGSPASGGGVGQPQQQLLSTSN